MVFRRVSLMFLVLMAWVSFAYSFSAPVPFNTRQTDSERRIIMGVQFEVSYYSSKLTKADIEDFYNKKLPPLGWGTRNFEKEINEASAGAHQSFSSGSVFKQNMVFFKGSHMLAITFLPMQDGEVRYTVSMANMDREARISETQGAESSSRSKVGPRKEVAPVYPGAAISDLQQSGNSYTATYFTGDDIYSVAKYYRDNMFRYEWNLVEESKIESMEVPVDRDKLKLGGYYSSDPQINMDSIVPKNMRILSSVMEFSNRREDSCQIVFSSMISDTGLFDGNKQLTSIKVDYHER